MVTDLERDYMYDSYAESKTMRLNLEFDDGSLRCWTTTAGASS